MHKTKNGRFLAKHPSSTNRKKKKFKKKNQSINKERKYNYLENRVVVSINRVPITTWTIAVCMYVSLGKLTSVRTRYQVSIPT